MQGFVDRGSVLPSLREVNNSLETLRRAAPSIFTDEIIDNIHQIIAKRRLSEKIKNIQSNESSSEQYTTAQKMKDVMIKQEEPNISPSRDKKTQVKNAKTKKYRSECKVNYYAELQPFWKEHHLKRLIDLYCKRQSINQIKENLQLQYPQIKKFITYNTIRSIFLRTIYAALRKLEKLIEEFKDVGLPLLLTKFDKKMMEAIKFDAAALNCRIKVLEVHFSDNVTSTLLRQTIEMLNSYLDEKYELE